jgi:hypothetical protein
MNFNRMPTDTDLNPGQLKAREYVTRFQAGTLDSEDLTEERLGAFYNDVITALIELIPPKHRGENWPPELVADMWKSAVPVDYDEAEQQRITRSIALHAYALYWNPSPKPALEASPEPAATQIEESESALNEHASEIRDTINVEEVLQDPEIIKNDNAPIQPEDVSLTAPEQQNEDEQPTQTTTEQSEITQPNEVPEVTVPTIDESNIIADELPPNEPIIIDTPRPETIENVPLTQQSPEQVISSAEGLRLKEIRAFAQGLEHFCTINDTRARAGYSKQFIPKEKLEGIQTKSKSFVDALEANDVVTAEATLHAMLVDFDSFGRSENRSSNVEDNLRSLQDLKTNLANTHTVLGAIYRRYSTEKANPETHKLLDTINRFGQRLDRAHQYIQQLERLGRGILGR